MADDYDNRNTFVLFKNDRKMKDGQPDYTGTFIDADNKPHFINGWSKTSKKNGTKFISGNMKAKDADGGARPAVQEERELDDTPF